MKKYSTLTFLFSLITFALAAAPATFGKKVDLRAGTTIMLELSETLTSDQMTTGKLVQFKVTTDVVVDGKVAIRTGALAWGRIKSMSEATYNNPAQLHIEVQHVQSVDGQQIALNGAEQILKGTYSSQGMQAQMGAAITATVMNDTEVKTK